MTLDPATADVRDLAAAPGATAYARVFSMRTRLGISHAVNPDTGKTFCGLDADGWAVDNGIHYRQYGSHFNLRDGCRRCANAIRAAAAGAIKAGMRLEG